MNESKLKALINYYQLLGHLDPENAAKEEIQHDSNMHSMQLFLTGAWQEMMATVTDEEQQHEALFALSHYLSDQSNFQAKLGVKPEDQKQWAVFEVDSKGQPGKRLDGLHYYMEDCRPSKG